MRDSTNKTASDNLPQGPETEIRKTLAAILQSPPFRASKQSCELLKFIIEQTLADRPEMLKERIIGAHVFGRPVDYATNDDPIVRARAAEVRKRLALYYLAAPEDHLRISIPSGSFKAQFERIEGLPSSISPAQPVGTDPFMPVAESAEAAAPVKVDGNPISRFHLRWWWLAVAASALIAALAIQHYFASTNERVFNRFWSPILNNSSPVLISLGKNPAYGLAPAYIAAYNRQHPGSKNEGMAPYVPLPPDAKLDGKDLVLLDSALISLGDVTSTSKILSLMVLHKKHFDIRLGRDMTFGDLNEDAAILVGAYNNYWTLSMLEGERYTFSARADIVDRTDPHKHWSTSADFHEDYAIVSRVIKSKTGKPILVAAGITGAGTRAAVEFITDPGAISAMAKSLPKGWETKNVEVILHASVTNGFPAAPDVVATYCW